jgi:hypothetical protein
VPGGWGVPGCWANGAEVSAGNRPIPRLLPGPAGRISVGGTADATLYGTFTGSPNSAGYIFELAYLPFSRGGPEFWPWLNFRIGLQYTHWNKFDGATTNIDGMGRNANGNNTFFAYIGLCSDERVARSVPQSIV